MKAILWVAGGACLIALGVAHSFGDPSAKGALVQTTEGPMEARYSPLKPDPSLPTFEQLKNGDPRFSTPVRPDVAEGHEARDAIRSDVSTKLVAMLGSLQACDPIRRTAYIQAMSRYIAASSKDQRDAKGDAPDPRWSTREDGEIGGSLDSLRQRGVISDGDMQRAMLGGSWQGEMQLHLQPPPRSTELRSACPAGTLSRLGGASRVHGRLA